MELTPVTARAGHREASLAVWTALAFAGRRITSGWADWCFKQLSGQWIDITGVPEGDYIVHVEINAAGTFAEGADRYPNVIETTIHVPNPRNKVTVDNSSLIY